MKTDILIPDNIFNHAENVAETMGITRNELYANAIQAYIQPNDAMSEGSNSSNRKVLPLGHEDDPRDFVVYLSDN